jgi:hypothetical protein
MENAAGAIADCRTWIAENYDVANPVERMIERSGLNARTFGRRFRAAIGQSDHKAFTHGFVCSWMRSCRRRQRSAYTAHDLKTKIGKIDTS